MVKARCVHILLLLACLALEEVSGFHPLASALYSRESKEGPGAEGSESSEELNLISKFGKSEIPALSSYVSTESGELSEEKRAPRNLIWSGRGPHRSFSRFGKSLSPLRFALGLEGDSLEEAVSDYDPNFFHRFSKAADRNHIRLGRSLETKLEDCKDCLHEGDSDIGDPALNRKGMESEPSTKSTISKKSKRSVSAFYNDVEFVPRVPLSWTSNFDEYVPLGSRAVMEVPTGTADFLNKDIKRAHSRNFLRFGRDPLDLHFLRFGKRGSAEENKSTATEDEDAYARAVRGRTNKNFIRFG